MNGNGNLSTVAQVISFVLVACSPVGPDREKGIAMAERKMTLWEGIATWEQQMPASIAKVETALGVKLAEVDRTDA